METGHLDDICADMCTLIRNRCGLMFNGHKVIKLHDSVLARMKARGIETLGSYYACVYKDDAEFNELVTLLTVNETYFMREPEHIELIASTLVPAMLEGRSEGKPVRILSAGCSTGEEAYSVAMALMERYGASAAWPFDIAGMDIDNGVLRVAREGVYGNYAFRAIDSELKQRYFKQSPDGLGAISETLKAKVSFIQGNLMADSYPDILIGMDIILYRNVSIYFDRDTQLAIFSKLAALLSDKGYLFTSATETLAHSTGPLNITQIDGLYVFHKCAPDLAGKPVMKPAAIKTAKPAVKHVPRKPAAIPAEQTGAKHGDAGICYDMAVAHAGKKQYAEAIRQLDMALASKPDLTDAMMLKASVLCNLKRLDEARQVCRDIIAQDRWNLQCHLLLGLMAHLDGDDEDAMKRFREAIYIDSSCWLAHYHIADMHRLKGDAKAASREYDIVINLLENSREPSQALKHFPLACSEAQVVHLCRHSKKSLAAKAPSERRYGV